MKYRKYSHCNIKELLHILETIMLGDIQEILGKYINLRGEWLVNVGIFNEIHSDPTKVGEKSSPRNVRRGI